MARKTSVGGQAVIEGVMMRGVEGIATAVRLENGTIEVDVQHSVPYTKRNKFLALPIVRGFISLFESLIVGIRTLNYSASFFEEDDEPSRFDKWFNGIFKDKSNDILMFISLILSLGFSLVLFFIFPTFVANLLYKVGFGRVGVNITEGVLRVAIFFMYLYLVGKMDDINRVFQYHGAEHKTIFCYENEKELTPENAAEFNRFHPRCGTNFLFIVMIVSIVLFSLMEFDNIWQKIAYRIILLPLVSGVSYEVIRWMGKANGKLSNIMAYPGLKLQELTTREPDRSQLEIAIIALKAAEGLDYAEDVKKYTIHNQNDEDKASDSTVGMLLNMGNEALKETCVDSYIIDTQLLLSKVLNRDKLSIITNRDELVSKEDSEEFKRLIDLRKNKMPIKYILGETEFMGINLFVKEGVLIPRPDTEILVEEVIKDVNEKGYKTICDVCSGSGAIGISIAAVNNEAVVECYDISPVAEEVNINNIKRMELSDRVRFERSDLLQRAIDEEKHFDVIVSNPPYIKDSEIQNLMDDVKNYEPHIALAGGEDGLNFYRKITEQSLMCLNHGGLLAFEIGYDQKESVEEIMKKSGFVNIQFVSDLSGNNRVVKGFLN